MKYYLTPVLLLMSIVFAISQDRNCGSMEYLQQQIQENPQRGNDLEELENFTQKWIQQNPFKAGELITIPVVFHVVYNTSSENISDAQIQSQLQVLNDDFRRLNSDADGTWSQAADTEIEFCLASVDPDGNTTNGITRTSTSVSSFSSNDNVKFNSSGGKDAWPASDYLNFWVCDLGGGLLGYAQFPGGSASTDGVVCDYQYVGTIGTATAPFDLGRTATHEVGHWLNLRHIWGDGGCGVDDFVSDTPLSDASNVGCSVGHVSCGSLDMVQNYMDYSDDACMNLFTAGQRDRMQAVFGTGGPRASLFNSNGCGNGNPPPPPPTCDDNEIYLTLNFDNYPEETSWVIKNTGGTTVASGGTYAGQPDGSTLVLDICLPNGCYDLIISDTYGDGMCCGYGNGSYSLDDGSTNLASGGNFGSSETTNFCIGGGQGPTCDDGILNNGEEQIDCGGPNCDPCESCDDGILNNGEEQIDCGGPNCNPCETCDDGILNNGEEQVDCGGPNCDPCDTGGGTDILSAHFFETGWDGWTDGGSDCYRYRGSRSWEGQYSIRIRDNSGSASSMTSQSYDLSSYNQVEVEFYFYPNSMENGEDFWLRYNDGSGWETVATWARGTDFNNNTFYVTTVVLTNANYNLTNNARFRFQCDASGNADRVYIDAVTITGVGSSARISDITGGVHTDELNSVPFDIDEESDYLVYPNPAIDFINIDLDQSIQKLNIYSITGELMYTLSGTELNNEIDISRLEAGMYLLTFETEEELLTQKFVKR